MTAPQLLNFSPHIVEHIEQCSYQVLDLIQLQNDGRCLFPLQGCIIAFVTVLFGILVYSVPISIPPKLESSHRF
jgi:hypothetical protein